MSEEVLHPKPTLEEGIATAIACFSPTDAAIAKLRKDYLPLVTRGVENRGALRNVHDARMVVKGLRVQVEKTRKELKSDALTVGRAIDGEAKRITGQLAPIETHLAEQENLVVVEEARLARLAEERRVARLDERCAKLAEYGAVIPLQDLEIMGDEEFDEFVERARVTHEEEQAAKSKAEAERKRVAEIEAAEAAEAEAERQRVLDEEAAKVKAEREELEKRKVEQDKREAEAAERTRVANAKLAEERARIEAVAEANRIAIRKELAARKAEQDQRDADAKAAARLEENRRRRIVDAAAEATRLLDAERAEFEEEKRVEAVRARMEADRIRVAAEATERREAERVALESEEAEVRRLALQLEKDELAARTHTCPECSHTWEDPE